MVDPAHAQTVAARDDDLTLLHAGMARGAGWNLLLRVVDRMVGAVSTVVLARLLVPADFGLVALAAALIELLALLGAWGLELALIRNPQAERRHFDTVWTFNLLFALTMAALLLLLAEPAARFYSEPRLSAVIVALAAARAIAGLQNIGVVLFQRDMDFECDFRFRLYKRLVSTFAVTLPLALLLRNHWALVAGTLASSGLGVLLSYRMHAYRPRLSLAAWRELFGISKWLQLIMFVRVAADRSSEFIIARFAGVAALGTYSLASEIARLPSAELTMAVHGGVFPGYARMAHDVARLKQTYLRVIALLYLATLPSGIGMAMLARPLVAVFLGEQWLPAVPVLQVLAVSYVLSVTSRSASYVYLTLDLPQHSATLAILRAAVSLGLMWAWVPRWGAQGAALALLVATLLAAPLNLWLLRRALHLTVGEVRSRIWRPVVATLTMAGLLALMPGVWSPTGGFFAQLLCLLAATAAGGLTYLATLVLLWHLADRPQGAETTAWTFLTDKASDLGGRLQATFTR